MRFSRRILAPVMLALLCALSFAPIAGAGDIDAVSFRDAQHGYISGGFLPGTMESPVGFVSVTADGGESWSARRVPNTRVVGVSATASGALAVGQNYGSVLEFSDATGVLGNLGSPVLSGSLFDIAELASGRIVAVGRTQSASKMAVIAVTANRGTSWAKSAPNGYEGPVYPAPNPYTYPPTTNASMAAVDESPDSSAWAFGNEWAAGSSGYVTYKRRLAFRSVDGGATWEWKDVPALTGQQPIAAVATLSSTTAFAFGEAGQYLKTVDGGVSWTQATLPVTANILAADSRNNRIVVVGESGTIARSLDGGTVWESVGVFGAGTLRGVTMVSDTEWIAVGADETILRTTNSGASWTGSTYPIAPTLMMTSPSSGFAFRAGFPVTIGGSASDIGVGVISVEYRIRRADGKCLDQSGGWTLTDTWLVAQTTNNWSTWTASWWPDEPGQMVTITARATDGVGTARLSSNVSGTPLAASVYLAGNAAFTTTTTVSAAAYCPSARSMRWKIGDGAYTAWLDYATTAPVTLTPSDGSKTVTFDFSADLPSGSATSIGQAADSIVLDTTAPVVSLVAPAGGYVLSASPLAIQGTSSDSGAGVSRVSVRIRRADGTCWTGSAWGAETWLPVATTQGPWTLSWMPLDELLASGQIVTIAARAEDNAGLTSTTAGVNVYTPVQATVSLEGGASVTETRVISADVSATPRPTYMRWRVDQADWPPFSDYSPDATVTLSAGDGAKTVDFQFSIDGSTPAAEASDTITLRTPTAPPAIAIGAPSAGFPLFEGTTRIFGTASNPGSTIAVVRLLIQRPDGQSWNGSGWAAGTNWLAAVSTDAWATWSYDWSPVLAHAAAAGGAVSVTARAENVEGLTTITSPVTSSAPVSASIAVFGNAPTAPRESVGVDILAAGAMAMRWKVDSGLYGSWQPYSDAATVTLTPGEGGKTVTFEFSPEAAGPAARVGARVSDAITLAIPSPAVRLTAPAQGFVLFPGTTEIAGVAGDEWYPIQSVEVRLRRADGLTWNGTGWVAGDQWLPAQSADGWETWRYQWTLALADIGPGGAVTVSARATNAPGKTTSSSPVVSESPVTASISLASGAQYARGASVPVGITAEGATHMRWKIDGGVFGEWLPYASSATVALTAGDGARTVTFEFSPDGYNATASSSDTIMLDTVGPTLSFTSPVLCYSRTATILTPTGTTSDALSGVSTIRMSITRNGLYWDHASGTWIPGQRWIPAGVLGAPAAWSYRWALDLETAVGTLPATIVVEAEDAAGNVAQATTVAMSKTKATVGRPYLSTYRPRAYRTFYAYGKLKPRHSGTTKVVIQRKTSRGYRTYTTKYPKNSYYTSTTSRWRLAVKLKRGTYRMVAYHREDATHVTSKGSYRYVTVR